MSEILQAGVYAIRNKVNGKVYVGSTTRPFKIRWINHRAALRHNRHINRHLQTAWVKYKEESFEFVVLEQCQPAECIQREQHWIDRHRSANRKYGYNARPAARGFLGFKHSEETKAKIAAAKRGKKQNITPEVAAKKAQAVRDYYNSPGAREKHSKTLREVGSRPEVRAKNSETGRRRYTNPEEREKQAVSMKKRYENPEFRKKRGEQVSKALANPEEKARRSAAARRMWENPEYHVRQSALLKELFNRPEMKVKCSAASKGKKRTPEAIEKVASKLRGRKHTAQACASMAAAAQARGRRQRALREANREVSV